MYFYERLIGVGTFCFFLFLTFFLIQSGKLSLKKSLKIYLVVLTILAFIYIPPPNEDLYRIMQALDSFRYNYDFNKMYLLLMNSSYPLAMLLYFLISKIGVYGLLPAIVTFFTYKNIFYIVDDTCKKNNLTNKNVAWVFLFAMANGMFGYLITNIRSLWALSIIAKCVYDEIMNNKKIYRNLLLYVATLFIHQISVLVVAYRFMYGIFFEKKFKPFYKAILLVIVAVSYVLLNKYYLSAYNKFLGYHENAEYFWLADMIKMIVMNLFIFYSLSVCNKRIINKNNQFSCEKRLIKFIGTLIFLIIILGEYNIFIRVSYFCSILFLPILACIIGNLGLLNYKKSYTSLATFTTMFLLLISATRGHLSSFKFLYFK